MLPKQLKKILELSKKTGDRVIIYDANDSESSYVIMATDKYLEMIDDSEKVSHKKVENKKEIKAENDDLESQLESLETPEFIDENEDEESLTEEDLTDRINQEISMWKNKNKSSDISEEDSIKKSWKIPPAVKNKAHNIE